MIPSKSDVELVEEHKEIEDEMEDGDKEGL